MVDTDPAGARSRIEAAGAETERLQHLVDGLLALARAEGRNDVRETVDVAAVARERAEIWRPLAEEQGVTMTVSTPTTALAEAVPGAVEQIVDNYVDNALAVLTDGGHRGHRSEPQRPPHRAMLQQWSCMCETTDPA